MTSRDLSLVCLGVLTLALGGCMADADTAEPQDGEFGESAEKIIGGTPATGFPEAAIVDIEQNGKLTMGCSGTVIAPRVVLTAGHCVADGTGWRITAPYASGQKAYGSSKAVYDWHQTNDQVSPSQHDVGLVFLDTDITLQSYPTIATSVIPDNSEIVTVGRVRSGQLSHTELYVSPPEKARVDTTYGFKFDYAAPMAIEHGDSGGASYVSGTHTIVSVNSTGDSSTELLARVDLVSSWIQQQIAAHGGNGPGATTPGDQPSTGGQGGSGPSSQPSTGGPGGGTPGGRPTGGHHCVYIPWYRMYYCW